MSGLAECRYSENDVQGAGNLRRETRRIAITRGKLLSEHRDLEATV